MQPYLLPGLMTNSQKKFVFLLRARMVDLKFNFKGSHNNLKCELCGNHDDDQESLLVCEKLKKQNQVVTIPPQYNDIFSTDLKQQLSVLSILEENYKLRKVLFEEKKRK